MNKHLIWGITLIVITLMLCGTLIYLNYNSWTVRFEMDENTLKAVESIEYPIINEAEKDCGVNKMINELQGCNQMTIYDGFRTVQVIDVKCIGGKEDVK